MVMVFPRRANLYSIIRALTQVLFLRVLSFGVFFQDSPLVLFVLPSFFPSQMLFINPPCPNGIWHPAEANEILIYHTMLDTNRGC